MSSVFICHSPSDAKAAALIVEHLKKAGHTVLSEEHGLRDVAVQIDTSDIFLLLISLQSVGSEDVLKELGVATAKAKRIVPLMMGKVELPAKFEYALAGLQRIDLSKDLEGNMSQVLGAVAWFGPQQDSPLDATFGTLTDSAHSKAMSRERYRGALHGIVCWGLGALTAVLLVTGRAGLHQSELYLTIALSLLYGTAIGAWFSRPSMSDRSISIGAILFTTVVVFANGGVFWMLYGRSHPFFQEPGSSEQEDWRFYSAFGPIFGGTLWVLSKMTLSRLYTRNLRTRGRQLLTDYKGVRIGSARGVHGCFARQIVSQWCDPRTNDLALFYSKNLWFDPSEFIDVKAITVYVDPANLDNYFMDLSFLPKVQGSFWSENLPD